MRNYLLAGSILVAVTSYSQNTINVDNNTNRLSNREFLPTGGFPLSSTKYVKIASGSAYLSDNFQKGTLMTADSVQFNNINLKLDLLDNSIIYKNAEGEDMICSTQITNISLTDAVTGRLQNFVIGSSIPGADAKAWYQVLSVGNVTLYKQIYKDVAETKPYGSSVTEQTIRTSDRYFISVNNTFVRLKKPKEIAENVSKNAKQLTDYIDKEKLSGKRESDYIAAVEYYNSLNN